MLIFADFAFHAFRQIRFYFIASLRRFSLFFAFLSRAAFCAYFSRRCAASLLPFIYCFYAIILFIFAI